MSAMALDPRDFFLLVRAIAFAGLNEARKTTDVFGDELLIGEETLLAGEPFRAGPEEVALMARRVAGFSVSPP